MHNRHLPAGAGLRRRPGRFAHDQVLVEGFDRDAVVLARLLTREGRRVTLAGMGDASQQALELRASGVTVRARAALDAEPGQFEEAFLDVWTPEVAPRVALLRESGCVLRCLGDLVLERAAVPTIGVTGTAGKTTTAAFLTFLLRRPGSPCMRARPPARRTSGRPPSSCHRPPTGSS